MRKLSRVRSWPLLIGALTPFFILPVMSLASEGQTVVVQGEADANIATSATLARRLPELRFDKVALDDVVDFLRDVTGVKFSVDWKALEDAHIDRKGEVSAKFRDIPLSTSLDNILAAAADKGALGWKLENGVIVISTAAALEKELVTRTYDVSFFPAEHPSATRPTTRPLESTDALSVLIYRVIAPESRQSVGCTRLSEEDGKLIVVATPANQKAIEKLMPELKRDWQKK